MSGSSPNDMLEDALPGLRRSEEQAALLDELEALREQLRSLPAEGDPTLPLELRLRMAEVQLGLERGEQAWELARDCFDSAIELERWETAARACDAMFLSEQPQSLTALGHGVWLAVTWPVPPALTVRLLHHIVDETPADSDGGPVAAAAAHYIVHLRAEGEAHENLGFLTNEVLVKAARRHRGIEGEQMVKTWMEVLGLNDPEQLLPMLATVVDALVEDRWWFDRDELRGRLPSH